MSLVYQTHNQAHAHAHASAPYGYHNNVNNQMVPGAHYYPQNATYMPQGYVAQQFQHPYQQPQQQLQEQPSAGGVCETVDYDFKMMTEFVIQNAYLTFDKEIITDFDDKTLENSDVVEIFTNGVTFVLKSIRLPESTIYLALNYLHKSVNKLKKQQQSSTESKSSIFADASENVIYQYLVIALVLANKFNDDKTFTNKSWSEATGMDLQTINKMERELLNLFNWNLNDVIFETKLYAEYAKSFEIYSNAMSCKREASNHFNVPSAAPSQPSHHYTQQQQQQQQQQQIPSYDYVESSPLLNYNYGANTSVQAPQYATHGQNDLCPSAATPGSSNGLETPITLPSMLNNSSNNYFFSSPTGPESQSFVAQPHQYQQPARTYNDYSSPSNYYNNQYPHPSANMGMSSNYYAHPQNYMSGPMPVDMQLQNQMQMQPHPQMQVPLHNTQQQHQQQQFHPQQQGFYQHSLLSFP